MLELWQTCKCGCGQIPKKQKSKYCSGHNSRVSHPKGMKDKHHSEETLKKMFIARSGKNHPTYGKQLSKEWRQKLSEAAKRRYLSEKIENRIGKPMLGKHHSEETKKKMSEAGKVKHFSENHRKKLSEIMIGRIGKNHPAFGTRRSEKTKMKMSEIQKEHRKKQIFPLIDTKIEVKLQNFLKLLGLEFFTHQYMHIEHGYQCDILIPSMNMILEADGDYWHKYPIGKDIDKIRTKELIEKGFKVFRLWESEIKEMNLEKFKLRLLGNG